MNYYQARQLIETKKWAFTKVNDHKCWKVGYCAEFDHDHETEKDAQDCYGKWMLENKLQFYPERVNGEGDYRKCQECDKLTNGCAEVDMHFFYLCNEHQTKEVMQKLFKSPSQIWSSY